MAIVKLSQCIGCGCFSECSQLRDRRCAGCSSRFDNRRTAGSVMIKSAALTQRELAQLKRDFHRIETILGALDARRAAFMQKVQEEITAINSEVEQQAGQSVKEMGKDRQMLRAKLQQYMEESGTNKMRIRDLLVEVKNEVVNAGNRPLWTQITEKMGDLLKWSREELAAFIKANYSQPEYGNRMHVTPLPEKKQHRMILDGTSLEKLAEAHVAFSKTGAAELLLATPGERFRLTGSLVRANGLLEMMRRQREYKRATKIADTKFRNGTVYMSLEGPYVRDPNTVLAFLSERVPNHIVTNVQFDGLEKIALQLSPASNGGESLISDVLDELLNIQHNISLLLDEIHTGSSSDVPDGDVGDGSIQHEMGLATDPSFMGTGFERIQDDNLIQQGFK